MDDPFGYEIVRARTAVHVNVRERLFGVADIGKPLYSLVAEWVRDKHLRLVQLCEAS